LNQIQQRDRELEVGKRERFGVWLASRRRREDDDDSVFFSCFGFFSFFSPFASDCQKKPVMSSFKKMFVQLQDQQKVTRNFLGEQFLAKPNAHEQQTRAKPHLVSISPLRDSGAASTILLDTHARSISIAIQSQLAKLKTSLIEPKRAEIGIVNLRKVDCKRKLSMQLFASSTNQRASFGVANQVRTFPGPYKNTKTKSNACKDHHSAGTDARK